MTLEDVGGDQCTFSGKHLTAVTIIIPELGGCQQQEISKSLHAVSSGSMAGCTLKMCSFLSVVSTRSSLLLFSENSSFHATFLPAGFLSEMTKPTFTMNCCSLHVRGGSGCIVCMDWPSQHTTRPHNLQGFIAKWQAKGRRT